MPARLLAALVALFVIVPAATASASFDGSNGKVAFVGMDNNLYIDDPFDAQPPQGPLAKVSNSPTSTSDDHMAAVHPPAWSPDGTLLAYTAPVDDSYGLKHSAVFVMKADGTGAKQVTHPFALEPDTCEGQCDNGHASFDGQPTWTPDGKIAYIRMVYSGDESPKVSQRGTAVRVVDPSGGGDSQRYYIEPRANGLITGFVWPKESIHPFAVIGSRPDKKFILRNLGTGTTLASEMGIIDLDASPVDDKLAYSTIVGGYAIHVVDFAGRVLESFQTPITDRPDFRFTPDGNSILRRGCAKDRDGVQHCGLVTHRLADPDGDIRPQDPVVTPFLDMQHIIKTQAFPGYRGNFDIQSQDLPVILIPGFLGSEIQCDGKNVWMPVAGKITMRPIALSADGSSNQTCLSAGTTGKPVGRFTLLDVYAHLDDWLESLDPVAGGATFGWDWRKAPQESLDELGAKIDELLAKSEISKLQGAKRVTLAGHSYGAVLARLYINDPERSRKVARTLNVGAPMWGAIKPFFPLVFGIEGPGWSALDMFVENEDLKDTMRNFPGAYHLLAGDNFGQWLTVDGQMKDQAGVKAWMQTQGANAALFEDARKTHAEGIDGWLDYDGRIDDRAVVGVGYYTPGDVDVVTDPEDGEADIEITYMDGDITVPVHSASQKRPGQDPLGDPINLQYRCGAEHMDQTKDEEMWEAYHDFLLIGRTPRKLPEADCEPEGDVVTFHEDVDIPLPVLDEGFAAKAAGPLSLGQAAWEGKAEIVDLPSGTQVLTQDSIPVSLAVDAAGLSMTVTDLDAGRRVTYGPLTGDVVITPGKADVPAVTVDGQAVTPTTDTGGGTTPDTKPEPKPAEPQPPADPQPPAAIRASVRGGKVKLTKAGVAKVSVTGSGTGTLTLTAKVGKKTVRIGSARVTLVAGRTVVANVRVSKAARKAAKRGTLRATATLALSGGVTAKAVMKLR